VRETAKSTYSYSLFTIFLFEFGLSIIILERMSRPINIPPRHLFNSSTTPATNNSTPHDTTNEYDTNPEDVDTRRSSRGKSKNIPIILTYTFLTFAARSTWSQTVLSAFVFLLSNNAEYVGFITAMMGICQLATSLPSGVLADKYRRDEMLKVGAVIGCFAILVTFIASLGANLRLLTVALCLWGVFWGICNTTISALFADSIPDGERSKFFTQRNIAQILGNLFGPVIALIMFTNLGDEWTTSECKVVMALGQFIGFPAIVLLCFMNDDYCVSHDEEDERIEQLSIEIEQDDDDDDDDDEEHRETFKYTAMEDGQIQDKEEEIEQHHKYPKKVISSLEIDSDLTESLLSRSSSVSTSTSTPIADNLSLSRSNNDESDIETEYMYGIPKHRLIPIFIASADLIQGLGAGMSIRYFPIFFLDNLHLSPDKVQIIMILAFSCLTFLTKIVQRIGEKYGRVQVAAFFRWIGVSLTIALVLSYHYNMSTPIICTIFILRMAAMNSTSSQTRSVLMDAVPSGERAKWSSLESVNMFSWSGSAAIGGLLVNWKGIMFNFSITATIQLLGTIPLFLLFDIVKNEQQAHNIRNNR